MKANFPKITRYAVPATGSRFGEGLGQKVRSGTVGVSRHSHAALALDLLALPSARMPIHEADASADERQEVRAVEASAARLRHVRSLKAISSPFVREPAPFVTRCRSRTVANGDSITFDVRRCFQCSAGKS